MNEEIWLPVKGFEGRYEVSNKGNVRSLGFIRKVKNATGWMKGRVLKMNKNKPGYYQVFLSGDDRRVHVRRVHRLVAESFIPIIEGKEAVNHISANILDNTVENLEWCTLQENSRHAFNKTKTMKNYFTPVKVTIEKDGVKNTFDSISDAEKFIGCRKGNAVMALRRKNKCKGHNIVAL